MSAGDEVLSVSDEFENNVFRQYNEESFLPVPYLYKDTKASLRGAPVLPLSGTASADDVCSPGLGTRRVGLVCTEGRLRSSPEWIYYDPLSMCQFTFDHREKKAVALGDENQVELAACMKLSGACLAYRKSLELEFSRYVEEHYRTTDKTVTPQTGLTFIFRLPSDSITVAPS
eukprot:GHVQ01039698.1.p1 GENE.GHVQ01039698.1~~GHVQ01039698.1.p1  ORF type:complete len:173 (+),score=14.51 GHVQ01039698.1:71-589(+)